MRGNGGKLQHFRCILFWNSRSLSWSYLWKMRNVPWMFDFCFEKKITQIEFYIWPILKTIFLWKLHCWIFSFLHFIKLKKKIPQIEFNKSPILKKIFLCQLCSLIFSFLHFIKLKKKIPQIQFYKSLILKTIFL